MLRASLLSALALFLVAGAAGCGNAPGKGDCEEVLEHLEELEAAAGTATG